MISVKSFLNLEKVDWKRVNVQILIVLTLFLIFSLYSFEKQAQRAYDRAFIEENGHGLGPYFGFVFVWAVLLFPVSIVFSFMSHITRRSLEESIRFYKPITYTIGLILFLAFIKFYFSDYGRQHLLMTAMLILTYSFIYQLILVVGRHFKGHGHRVRKVKTNKKVSLLKKVDRIAKRWFIVFGAIIAIVLIWGYTTHSYVYDSETYLPISGATLLFQQSTFWTGSSGVAGYGILNEKTNFLGLYAAPISGRMRDYIDCPIHMFLLKLNIRKKFTTPSIPFTLDWRSTP